MRATVSRFKAAVMAASLPGSAPASAAGDSRCATIFSLPERKQGQLLSMHAFGPTHAQKGPTPASSGEAFASTPNVATGSATTEVDAASEGGEEPFTLAPFA